MISAELFGKILMRLVVVSAILPSFNSKALTDTTKTANALINESSPYLLQHAYNPVKWQPWGNAAFAQARREKKLVIISIGYSSCHWCHVMEEESFENENVAAYMNEHFVCIKVDREERPDVDQVYMTAVQLMTGQGGWPLNCVTLPDGRPVFGGTYFSTDDWISSLSGVVTAWKDTPEQLTSYAAQIAEGIKSAEVVESPVWLSKFSMSEIAGSVSIWQENFDWTNGGEGQAPKFPMPNNYEFLMAYAHLTDDSVIMNHVDRTLEKMAMGGIYDQIGGGFMRYSTDAEWKVPHFEKMLYDNAQLLSLYAQAYRRTGGNPVFGNVLINTLGWMQREMLDTNGSFYSAMDADSEGEEGRYYTWDEAELKNLLGEDYDRVRIYFSLGENSLWEKRHILRRQFSDQEIVSKYHIRKMDFIWLFGELRDKLLEYRNQRLKPGLDTKAITSWNAMAVIGVIETYYGMGGSGIKDMALKTGEWLATSQMKSNGALLHTGGEGKRQIDGFADDYAFTILAFVKLYELTFDEVWIERANKLATYAIANFFDAKSGMFFYTSKNSGDLIARQMQLVDGVVPSANSAMATALFKLGHLTANEDYISKSYQMLANVYSEMSSYGSSYSNWALLAMHCVGPFYEVAITGPDYEAKRRELMWNYLPMMMLMGGTEGKLPLLEGKFGDETRIFVCVDKTCMKPETEVEKALEQIKY
jgi:uncharacterized protein YyaL (SSP411 family)